MTFLRHTAFWENKLLGMEAMLLQMLLSLFLPFLVSIWHPRLKLGQSAEEHTGSSPVLCSYLFTGSGSPSKDIKSIAVLQPREAPDLGQSILLKEDWSEPTASTSERSHLFTAQPGRERQSRTSPMVQRKIGHITWNKGLLLWGGIKTALPEKKKKVIAAWFSFLVWIGVRHLLCFFSPY